MRIKAYSVQNCTQRGGGRAQVPRERESAAFRNVKLSRRGYTQDPWIPGHLETKTDI